MSVVEKRVPAAGRPVASPQRVPLEAIVGRVTAVIATPLARVPPASGPLLLLGRWCEAAVAADGGAPYAVVPELWSDRSRIPVADAYCWDVFTRLRPEVIARLNRLHGTSHAAPYWEFLITPWLLQTIHALYDRYLLACEARRLAPGAPLLVPRQREGPPSTATDALRRLQFDAGNASLFHDVFEALGLCTAPADAMGDGPARPVLADAPADDGRLLPTSVQWRVERAACRWLARPAGRRILVDVPHFTVADVLRLALRVPGLRIVPANARPAMPTFSVDPRRRDSFRDIPAASEFETMVTHLLPRLVPMALVEAYEAIVAASHAVYGGRAVPVVFTYYDDDVLMEFVARTRASGVPVAAYQHGGGYGQYRTYPFERYELAGGHTFLAWGAHGARAQALPSPHLSRLRDRHRGGRHLVLVEMIMPSYLYRFHSKPVCADERVEQWMVDFVEHLPMTVRSLTLLKRDPAFHRYRRHRHPTLEGLGAHGPAGRAIAYEWMREARLAVVTYPETAFLEALTLNVPMVAAWDDELFEIRDDARAYFDALHAAGILHRDPVSAAAHAGDIYAHATEWWRTAKVQRARQAFLDRFGLAARGWRGPWTRYLRDMTKPVAS